MEAPMDEKTLDIAYNRAIVAGEKANEAAYTLGEEHQRTKAWRRLQFTLWNMYLKLLGGNR